MDLSTITVADFKSFFVRDFPYLSDTNISPSADNASDYVLDSDITKAFSEAKIVFNQSLYPDDDTIKIAYLYLTAHYMVGDLKSAMQGIFQNGNFPVSGRRVGNVSENYAIPKKYLSDPMLSFFTSSYYGMKYLSMTLPRIVGNVKALYGRSHA